MANATPSRIGQINLAGDAKAMFLKVFGGEVLTAFNEDNTFLDKHVLRTISSGKQAQFPATWKATAAYHTPGVELVGQTIAGAERLISLDDQLIADVFIPNVDEAMNHYDYRSEYTKQCAEALRRTFSQNVAQVMVLAARASATITGANGGTVVTDADGATNMDSLVDSIFDAVQALAEKDVPMNDRFIFLRPAQYYALVASGNKAIDKDVGGSGGLAAGAIYRLAGAPIVMTNHLPDSDISTGPTAYQGDFTTTIALVAQRGAAGTVKLRDLAVESAYDIRRQGTLVLAKMLVGHGILRPECAVEIASA